MSTTIYHIKIKKEYASAILEDLQQIDAIEMVEDSIPEWQQHESLKRLHQMKEDPNLFIDESDFISEIDKDVE